MTGPTVCAIMLTRDRPELAKRAVECFRKQTYANKILLIWDSGKTRLSIAFAEDYDCSIWATVDTTSKTIGELRNVACKWICSGPTSDRDPSIFIHWDDDDWSHPNRIAEQVALLQASGADVVGYREMLFWRTNAGMGADAWLYTATRGGVPALGTSLCYWRKTWERHHFANETQGVEDHWMREKNVVAVSSLQPGPESYALSTPRMIARIHGGNTSNGYDLEKHVEKGSREWKRVPSWDAHVREILG